MNATAITESNPPDTRTARRPQFEFERLAHARLLACPAAERRALSATIYDELFRRFPQHSVFQLSADQRRAFGRRCAALVAPFCRPGDEVLEVGCGRGDVLVELAARGCRCTGIEPSREMIAMNRADNVRLQQGWAESLDFPDRSFDLVFSQQVVEHLHPEDVPRHLQEAFRVLKPGGRVLLETPNCRTGPQDISRGFTRSAEGLHLKEWSVAELTAALRRAGFVSLQGFLAGPFLIRRSARLHRVARVPATVKRLQDAILAIIPGDAPRRLAAKALGLDDICLFARKPACATSQAPAI
jgi:SAM-dependent methyltransferase